MYLGSGVLLLLSCTGTDEDESPAGVDTGEDVVLVWDTADTADTGAGACTNDVVGTEPVDRATEVTLDASFTATFAEPEPDALVVLMDESYAAVEGASTVGEDALTVVFTPDSPLAPGVGYTAGVSYCWQATGEGGTFQIALFSFTTTKTE